MTSFTPPSWVPQVEPGSRILVAGASGGIGRALTAMLARSEDVVIGAHRDSAPSPLRQDGATIHDLQAHLDSAATCDDLVEAFIEKSGGIDGLVVLSGVSTGRHWKDMTEELWDENIKSNLSVPFFLARAAMCHMGTGGAVVLTGTESALHGGSATSFPYGIAKRGTECLVQGLAREGAARDITVNGIRMGLILSGTHERWQGKTEADMKKRADMVPLKRGGSPDEAASMFVYLLSQWARFITGQMIPVTGGDWL